MKIEDRHIEESLRLSKWTPNAGSISALRSSPESYPSLWATAQTLAKLECAVEALDLISNGSSKEAADFARHILTAIRSESHE